MIITGKVNHMSEPVSTNTEAFYKEIIIDEKTLTNVAMGEDVANLIELGDDITLVCSKHKKVINVHAVNLNGKTYESQTKNAFSLFTLGSKYGLFILILFFLLPMFSPVLMDLFNQYIWLALPIITVAPIFYSLKSVIHRKLAVRKLNALIDE